MAGITANILTHEHIFDFIFNDGMLNELYWRADQTTNCLINDIQPLINADPYLYSKNITVQTNITNEGIYINIYDQFKQIGHVSLHLKLLQSTSIKPPGALHIQNDGSKVYQLLSLTRYPNSCNPSSISYTLSSFNKHKSKSTKSICTEVTITSNIILSVLEKYTSSPVGNPLSLYHPKCSNNTVHPYLMDVIRTRPSIYRTGLTKGLKGGKKSKSKRKTYKVRKHKLINAKYKTKK
jgi:hypothetical protein